MLIQAEAHAFERILWPCPSRLSLDASEDSIMCRGSASTGSCARRRGSGVHRAGVVVSMTCSGSAGSFTYSVRTNMANKPVNFVRFPDAARMANWLTNGQGSGSTESGAYTMSGNTTIAITRDLSNPNQVFLPTLDEWNKAAFHQPASQGATLTTSVGSRSGATFRRQSRPRPRRATSPTRARVSSTGKVWPTGTDKTAT
jgi:hypothetical protein